MLTAYYRKNTAACAVEHASGCGTHNVKGTLKNTLRSPIATYVIIHRDHHQTGFRISGFCAPHPNCTRNLISKFFQSALKNTSSDIIRHHLSAELPHTSFLRYHYRFRCLDQVDCNRSSHQRAGSCHCLQEQERYILLERLEPSRRR